MPLAAFPKCFLDDLCVTGLMTPEEWIERSGALDIDGLEFYWGFTPRQDPERLERLRRQVAAQGRRIPMMCYSPDFTRPDEAEREREVENQIRAIHATRLLGGRYCRVLSGQRRPDVSPEDGIRWAAECIRKCLPAAQEAGVTLILENHYKDGYWSYPEFAQRADLFIRLVEAVGAHPRFGINFDPSNALIAGDDPYALLETLGPHVVTMHASDRFLEGGDVHDLRKLDLHPETGYAALLRHGVIGQGLIDYDRVFSLLKGFGFTGWISIEDGQDPEVGLDHLQQSARFLRAKMHHYGIG